MSAARLRDAANNQASAADDAAQSATEAFQTFSEKISDDADTRRRLYKNAEQTLSAGSTVLGNSDAFFQLVKNSKGAIPNSDIEAFKKKLGSTEVNVHSPNPGNRGKTPRKAMMEAAADADREAKTVPTQINDTPPAQQNKRGRRRMGFTRPLNNLINGVASTPGYLLSAAYHAPGAIARGVRNGFVQNVDEGEDP